MTAQHCVSVGPVTCGSDQLFLISGPCVIEDEFIMMHTAERLKTVSQRLNLPLIFKSSFMKDNRSAMEHFHGPGLDKGLGLLAKIRETFDVPIYIHEDERQYVMRPHKNIHYWSGETYTLSDDLTLQQLTCQHMYITSFYDNCKRDQL